MKNEKIILAIAIAAFSIYLTIMEKNKSNDSLPKLDEIKTYEVTDINLSKNEQTISIKKKGTSWWVLTDKEVQADQREIDNMLDAIRKIELTALVSEKNDSEQYGFDPQNSICVEIKKEGQVLREFDVGKAATTNSHTFVRLKGNQSIYEAVGDFKPLFEKLILQLREKPVPSFDSNAIEKKENEDGAKI